jgi:hypothetical protein
MEDPRERSRSYLANFFTNWGQMEIQEKEADDNAFVLGDGYLKVVCNSHSNYCRINSMNSTLQTLHSF